MGGTRGRFGHLFESVDPLHNGELARGEGPVGNGETGLAKALDGDSVPVGFSQLAQIGSVVGEGEAVNLAGNVGDGGGEQRVARGDGEAQLLRVA